MANRTPPSEWGILFNFAGGGLVHMNLFPIVPMSADCCTALSTVFALFLRRGSRAAQPTTADVPDQCLYYVTDELLTEQAVSGTWVNYADGPGFDPAALFGAYLLQGDRASQPAAASTPEFALYFVTDEGLTEQVVAAAWTPYSGSSAVPRDTAIAYNSTTQSVPSGGPNILAFDTIVTDTAGIFDLGMDDTLATIQHDGVYLVLGTFAFQSGIGNYYSDVRIVMNGTIVIGFDTHYSSDVAELKMPQAIIPLVAGDTLTLECYNGYGGTINSQPGDLLNAGLRIYQLPG